MTRNFRAVFAFAREMHPKTLDVYVQYGTAGFRTKAVYLEHVIYRMGLLAVLRSRYKNGATIGVMITASHNLEPDNGVKLVDPQGEMLEESWEEIATKLANVSDTEIEDVVQEIVDKYVIDMKLKASVYVGMDTRYTSPGLSKAAVNGVLALQGTPKDYGVITTPMLHYFVTCKNTRLEYGAPNEEAYYEKLVDAFTKLRGENSSNGRYTSVLYFDGANGVGGRKMNVLKKRLEGYLDVRVYNAGGNGGKLNYLCGADHVKVQQKEPIGTEKILNQRFASVDGDADRLVYFYVDEQDVFHLLDGDRIATLLAGHLMKFLRKSGADGLKLGLVQTAYANGASTEYITKELKVPVSFVKTGVKHLHHEAKKYDIGVYFEANGHGTIVYSKDTVDKIKAVKHESSSDDAKQAANHLLNFINLTNQAVGDAISDLLLVETVLHYNGWDIAQWLKAYDDLPCRQLKVTVKDRNVITTADAERKCLTPEGLQQEIDELVSKYSKGRAFVRPSGTEDIVRVYAETASLQDTERLALEVALAVYQTAGGTGDPPVVPV